MDEVVDIFSWMKTMINFITLFLRIHKILHHDAKHGQNIIQIQSFHMFYFVLTQPNFCWCLGSLYQQTLRKMPYYSCLNFSSLYCFELLINEEDIYVAPKIIEFITDLELNEFWRLFFMLMKQLSIEPQYSVLCQIIFEIMYICTW